MSPELQGVLVGGLVGFVSSIGTLIVARWLRSRWGNVRCEIAWLPEQTAGSVDSPGGLEVRERRLTVTFLNRKEVPVTVWGMQVVFYKGGKPLDEWLRPNMQFAVPGGGIRPMDLVNLPPRVHITSTMSLHVFRNLDDDSLRGQKLQAVHEADRVEFVAILDGARDIKTELAPWNDPTPQTKRC
jgi:hypothetical protein